MEDGGGAQGEGEDLVRMEGGGGRVKGITPEAGRGRTC